MFFRLKNYFLGGGVARIAFYSAVYNFTGKVISSVFIALSFVIIVKNLNVANFGQYIFYVNLVFFIVLLLDFGATEVMLRYVPEYIEKKDFSLIKGLLNRFIFIISAGALISILSFFLLFHFFPKLFLRFELSAPILACIAIFGCLKIFTFVLGNILNAFFYQFYKISFEIVTSVLKLLLIFVLLKVSFGAWQLILLNAFLDLFVIAGFYARICKVLYRVPLLDDKSVFARVHKFGINEYLYKLFWFFTDNRFDIYIVGFILGATKAGYFAFAASIPNLLIDWSPGFIIRPAVSPLFIKEYTAKKDTTRIKYLFQLHNKFLVFFTLPGFLIISILIDKIIIYIFDPKYLPSVNVFMIFIIAIFFSSMIVPLRNILVVMERTDISKLTNIVAIPKIALVFLLTKLAGINGAALAFTVSILAILGMNLILIRKVILLRYPWESFMKIAINSAISGFVLFLLRSQINNRISLILVVILGLIIYFFFAYQNKAFDKSERQMFNEVLKLKIWNF